MDDQLTALQQRVGTAVKNIRESKRLERPDVADRAGISLNHLGNIERGETNAELKTLLGLSVALEVDPGAFFNVANAISDDDMDALVRIVRNLLAARASKPEPSSEN